MSAMAYGKSFDKIFMEMAIERKESFKEIFVLLAGVEIGFKSLCQDVLW